MRRCAWLAFLTGCQVVFPLEPAPLPFERCSELPVESWRYLRVDRNTITTTQALAKLTCSQRGRVLTAINTSAEMDYVSTNFALAVPDESFIGLTRSGPDWIDPESCPTFTSFRTGEGDDVAAGCSHLVRDGLIDAACGVTTRYVICEQARPPIAGCGAPFVPGRYRAVAGLATKADAVAACNQPSEHVVNIESDTEQADIDEFAGNNSIAKYWIDGVYDPASAVQAWSGSTACAPYFAWATAMDPIIANGETAAVHEVGVGTRSAQATDQSGVICETD